MSSQPRTIINRKTLKSKTRPLPKRDIRGLDSLEHFISDIYNIKSRYSINNICYKCDVINE